MTLADIRTHLKSIRKRPDDANSETVGRALVALKSAAVERGDQAQAKGVWCLEQGLRAQTLYLRSFEEMKAGQFYQAWCTLEQAQLALLFLEHHDTALWPSFRLGFIREYIEKWQGLYPYKVFMSGEFVEHEKLCSICQKPVSPRHPCGHRVGEIYDGEMCARAVTKAEVLAISFVDKPVQKYAVPFLSDPKTGETRDSYDYRLLGYAISALRSPFDAWDVERTKKRQPHSRFRHVGRNDPCPCESGQKYKKCCLRESGILRPHVQFIFSKPPPADVAKEVYVP